MPRVAPGQSPSCIDEELVKQITVCENFYDGAGHLLDPGAGSICAPPENTWIRSPEFAQALLKTSFCSGYEPSSPCETPLDRAEAIADLADCIADPSIGPHCPLLMGAAFAGAANRSCPGFTKEAEALAKRRRYVHYGLGFAVGIGIVGGVWFWARKKKRGG